jgi:hypothetical protein
MGSGSESPLGFCRFSQRPEAQNSFVQCCAFGGNNSHCVGHSKVAFFLCRNLLRTHRLYLPVCAKRLRLIRSSYRDEWASVYQPSRKTFDVIGRYVSDNAAVAGNLLGYLKRRDHGGSTAQGR